MSHTTSRDACEPEVVERMVVEWAAEILEEPASAQDNFLDLGGHSMLAAELNQRVKDTFGAELDLQLLFEETIGKAAGSIISHLNSTTQNG
ncbi:phosphopantetheine-binding protein [Streptomyces sp. NBC_00859]|uniref:phosphopantetheine-binding protein n=1 Tax=Streptomyces sp. NBC_00859 TaxID=2903682 RepID=UPI00386A54CF|nr:phosphopantetheine-binding protein [Streptomyces sp. NBC_00859]